VSVAPDTGFTYEKFEHSGGDVIIFTIHGRTRLNVVGGEILNDCAAGIRALSDDADVRCAVLQGASEDSFVGGADLRELQALETHDAAGFVGAVHAVCQAIREFPVPVLARVRGHCLGAGMEIAAACDFRICDASAVFGMPEVRVGVPSVVEAALLPHLIGFGKTRELVFRGHLIDANEAEKIGFVEQQIGEEDIDAAIAEAVGDILECAPNAIRLQKKLCHDWERLGIDEAVEGSLAVFARAYETDEPKRYCQQFFDRKAAAKAQSSPD